MAGAATHQCHSAEAVTCFWLQPAGCEPFFDENDPFRIWGSGMPLTDICCIEVLDKNLSLISAVSFHFLQIVSYSAAAARLPDSSLSLFPKAWPARDAPLSSSAPAAGHPSFPLGHTSFPLATPARGSGAQTALDGFPSALPGIAEEAVSAPGATPAPQPTAALNTLNRAISTGIINSIIGMPVMLSFSAIIFRHPFFGPYLPALVKLVFLSSALHQAVFAAFSTMRFAVGQVQDVGLIFLSAIATSVADDCLDMGVADADILGTTLATLSLGTLIVGALISATGKLRLASMVQYCPLPVVGAYLAAVGFFMLTAGVSLASGVTVKGWHGWGGLLNFDTMLKLTPALGMAFALAAVQRRSRSPYSLPLFLLAVPVAFYFFVFVGPWSLDDIRRAGWMAMPKVRGEGP